MMMLVWLVALAVIVWGVGTLARRGGIGAHARRGRAEALVHERYARGEIDEDTHQHMLAELRR